MRRRRVYLNLDQESVNRLDSLSQTSGTSCSAVVRRSLEMLAGEMARVRDMPTALARERRKLMEQSTWWFSAAARR